MRSAEDGYVNGKDSKDVGPLFVAHLGVACPLPSGSELSSKASKHWNSESLQRRDLQ